MGKRYFANNLPDFTGSKVEIPNSIKSLCQSYIDHILSNQNVATRDCDGGLYVGIAGVSYMFYYMSKQPEFSEKKQEFLKASKRYIKPAFDFATAAKRGSDQAPFLLGSCGSYAVAAAVMRALEDENESNKCLEKYASLFNVCKERDYLGCGSDEILVGRAGYLSGILFLERELNTKVLSDEQIIELCLCIVKCGLHYSSKHNHECPLMYSYYKTEYLGAAHGLSGILQMLLCFPQFFDAHPEHKQTVKQSIDYLLSLKISSGNFPSAMDEVKKPRPEEQELIHWCHGAPGVVYLMAKAYLTWNEEKYLDACLSCGELTWNKGLLKKGPGICHGIAGSGYVFLLLYRLTNDEKHLHRAVQFAQFLSSDEFEKARTPDAPLSLYEGLSGTVCFLADILQPEKAHFPFFDIF